MHAWPEANTKTPLSMGTLLFGYAFSLEKLALTQSCVHMPGLGADVHSRQIVVSRRRNVYRRCRVLLTDNSALGISG